MAHIRRQGISNLAGSSPDEAGPIIRINEGCPVNRGLLAAAAALAAAPCARAAEYTLMPGRQTVQIGNFSAAVKPVLTVESGDIVTIETAAAMEPEEIDRSGVVPPSAVPDYRS
jgi:hypothetical protein